MTDPLPDLNLMADMVKSAFTMGYARGRLTVTPENQERVKEMLVKIYPTSVENKDWRRMHWIKFRACYGAGFDLARLYKRLAEEKREAPAPEGE